MAKFVSGTNEVIDNILMHKNSMLKEVGEAVEKTCVDISKHAKAGHSDNMAHANKRYRNRTMQLTHAITPELVEANFKRVHGVVHTSSVEYAAAVELGVACNIKTGLPNSPYPYMTPAMLASEETFKKRLSGIL